MTTNEILEPVLNDNGEPHWLIYKGTKKISATNTKKKLKDVIQEGEPLLEKKIFELKPQGLWRCGKCVAEIISNPNAPVECYEEQGGCGRVSSFQPITKIINPDLWTLPKWEDMPVEDLDMLGVYDDMMKVVKQCIVFSDEIYYKLFILWIISSWKKDSWNTIGFLIFRGLISSGKTRALDLIRELGYRMIHTSGITFAAMLRVSHNYGAGVLIDEIDNKIDRRTESGRAMIDFLKPSYRKGSTYTTAHKDDQDDTKTYKNYGLKAFAGESGGYDEGMFSRAIDFQMEQDYPEIDEMENVSDELSRLRTLLLNYRYKTSDPPELDNGFSLRGRDREIYSHMIRTGMHIGVKTNDIVEFVDSVKKEKIDELQNTDEWVILNAIKQLENVETLDDAPESISYANICEKCGWGSDSKEHQKKRQKLGYIFKKKLILKTKRETGGTVLLLNDPKNNRKIKSLYRRYHI